jgi:hypothetical protein
LFLLFNEKKTPAPSAATTKIIINVFIFSFILHYIHIRYI